MHSPQHCSKQRRRGSVAPLVALCLIPIMGLTALVLDIGLLRDNRRRAVLAADTAALAAATDLFTHWNTNHGFDPSGTARTSARTTAKANGFNNDNSTNTVTVNFSPKKYQGGQWAGNTIPAGYVEVIINFNQSQFFGNVWGNGTLSTFARAVARGIYAPASPGILVLDPTDNNTLDLTASGNVTVTNHGSIVVNSKSANGGATCTSTGNAVADTINLSDNTFNHSNTGTLVGTVNYNVPPTTDPLAALTEPSQPAAPSPAPDTTVHGVNYSANNGLNYNGTATLDLYPGYYGGINITGSGSVVLHDNPDGSPGIYYIGSHGFSMTNSGGISGSNVMVYSDGTGNISITGSGSLTLSPPTSGTYQGISLFQERSSNKQISVTAQGNMNVSGTLYAAAAKVTLTGQGNYTNNLGSQWIAYQLSVTGSGSFNVNYDGQATPVRSIQLVE